jgi:hypothetical protein
MSDQLEFDLDEESEKKIREANEVVWSQTLDWMKKYDSMIIAANMLNSALRLYKTVLTADEYKQFCDTMYELSDQVQEMHSGSKH